MDQTLPSAPSVTQVPWHERISVMCGILLLAAVLPYLNTFDVPWYFDDVNNIVDNPRIRDLSRAVSSVLEDRGLAIITFALNHRVGGLHPFGYHLVNLAIHALSVLTVWWLLRKWFADSSSWPLVGALFFAVHPLQTQAVTYVVQRMTSLAALFFLVAVSSYLRCLDSSGRRRQAYYGAALICGTLAVLTKENTAVLPVVLLLAERYFSPGRGWQRQVMRVLPFCLAPAWKAVEMLLLPVWRGDVAASVRYADQLQTMQNVTPVRYLFTEFSVVWYYLKLLFLPVGQVLDYGWPVVERLLTVQNLMALAGLAGLWGLAWWGRKRWPLTSFGIAWFFITLSVESSIIPLDPMFEHRLYLPMFGFVLVAVDLLARIPRSKGQVAVAVTILSVLAVLTWQRNALWRDQVAFFEDNLRRRPDNVRVMVMLGNAHASAQAPEEGLRIIGRAMQLNPRYDFAYTAMGKILIDRGRGAEAIPVLSQGVDYHPTSVTLHEYLGIAYGDAGDFKQAMAHLRRALELRDDDASIYTNIGVIYSRMGNDQQAARFFERSVQLAPDSEQALFNYASALFGLGDRKGAYLALQEVVKVNPDNADAYYGMGTMALEFGSRGEAMMARDALRRLGDERAAELDILLGR